MGTSLPRRCPFCESNDVREVRMSGEELTGFRCRDCDQMFFVGAVRLVKAPRARKTRPTSLRAAKRAQPIRRGAH